MKAEACHPNQRVGIFVDVQNLYHSAKNLYRGRVNYRELLKHIVGDRQLIRALAYVVKSEGVIPQGGQQSVVNGATLGEAPSMSAKESAESKKMTSSEAAFFDALETAGMELRLKDIQIYADGFKKADWDVGMAVDAIRMSESLDVVVLVTGDGDFIPLVEYLKWGAGKIVEVAAFRRSTNGKLVDAADRFINIEDLPRNVIMRTRNSSQSS